MRIHKLRSLLYGFVLLPMSVVLADETFVIQQEISQGGTPRVVHMQTSEKEVSSEQQESVSVAQGGTQEGASGPEDQKKEQINSALHEKQQTASAREDNANQKQENTGTSSSTTQGGKEDPSVTWTDRIESIRKLFNYGYAGTDIYGLVRDVEMQKFVDQLQQVPAGVAFLNANPIPLRTPLERQKANLDFLTLYNYVQFASGAFNFAADPLTFSVETQKELQEWLLLIQKGEVTQALKELRKFAGGNRDAFVGALQFIDKVSACFQKTKSLGEWAKFLGDTVVYPATDILALANFLNQLANDPETLASIASQAYQTPHSFEEFGNAWGAQLHFLSVSRAVTFLINWACGKLPEPVLRVVGPFLREVRYVREVTFESFLTEPLINGAFSWVFWKLGVSDETSSFLGKVSSLSMLWYFFAWEPSILLVSGAIYVGTSYDKIWISLQNMYGSSASAVSSASTWIARSWLGRKVSSVWNSGEDGADL